MKIRFRSKKVVLSALSITIIMIGIYTTINYLYPNTEDNSNALSYSSSSDISFTFKPTLSIGLSADSLTIDNLVPGNTSDSNKVTVTVSSNTPYGYVLSAGVGSNESTDPYYNTSDLVHDNSTISTPTTSKFTSIDTNASEETLTTDNTWGYSTSTDGGTSWSTYSGLSHTATKPLLDISAAAQPSTIDFKIAARSATTQASGTYNNVITFYAVGKPEPMSIRKIKYMQDFKALSSEDKQLVLESMPVGQQYKLTDNRDGNTYWIAKQADGNIWMTQNLDFDIDSTKTYTPADTDIPDNWTPARSTTTDTVWNTGNMGQFNLYSYDPGNRYWDSAIITNDDGTIEVNTSDSGDSHYHIGNYYNWTAAVAMNNSSAYVSWGKEVSQSVCPAGWGLPIYYGNRSFVDLSTAQGLTAGDSGNIQSSPTYFVYGGQWIGNSSNVGYGGYYWSSVVSSSFNFSHSLLFYANGLLSPQASSIRYLGNSVRCVVR